MNRYIGGNFDSTSSVAFEQLSSSSFDAIFPKKINDKHRCFYETGTDALAQIILDIHKQHPLPVCLFFPGHYCLETISILQTKLNELLGFSVVSFSAYKELRIKNNSTNVLLFNHFNFYQESASKLIKQHQNKGWLVIEDFVHAPLDIAKTTGNYSVNSLRKLSNVEVGVCYTSSPSGRTSSEPSTYYTIKKEAGKIKSAFLKNRDKAQEQEYLDLFKKSEVLLKRKEIVAAYQPEVEKLMRINWNKLLKKRIENYNFLASKIESIKQTELLEGKYMYLILKATKRDELKKYMYDYGIFPVIHWPDSIDTIKNEIISFHIDQRYNLADMERVYQIIKKFYQIR